MTAGLKPAQVLLVVACCLCCCRAALAAPPAASNTDSSYFTAGSVVLPLSIRASSTRLVAAELPDSLQGLKLDSSDAPAGSSSAERFLASSVTNAAALFAEAAAKAASGDSQHAMAASQLQSSGGASGAFYSNSSITEGNEALMLVMGQQAPPPPPPAGSPFTMPPPPRPPSTPSPFFIYGSNMRPDDMSGLVLPKGYPLERHVVITADGFSLVAFRIPHGVKSPGSRVPYSSSHVHGPPVLLLHGISLSSTCWVVNEPDESLAFILADQGFDVWMLNARGTSFSRSHVQYTDKQPEFWTWSFDHIGILDIPAATDYIIETTGHARVAFIGHSQGATAAVAGLSYLPALGDKFSAVLLLAPCVYVKYMTSPFLTRYCRDVNRTGIQLFTPPQEIIWMAPGSQALMQGMMCQQPVVDLTCEGIMQGIFGPSEYITLSQYRRYFRIWPSSTSVWNTFHWAQLFNEPKPSFRMWNYGKDYDLTAIRAPVVLFSAGQDVMAAQEDVALVAYQLKKAGVLIGEHFTARYSHMDYIWDTNAKTRVYPIIVDSLRRLSSHA